MNQKNLMLSRNVSRMLDKILHGYDRRIRPNFGSNSNNSCILLNLF